MNTVPRHPSKREYDKRTRAERIAAGDCPQCGNPKDTDKYLCSECGEKKKKWDRAYRERCKKDGICPDCGHPRDREGVRCSKCLEKYS